jgi:Uma2 family endonuclease
MMKKRNLERGTMTIATDRRMTLTEFLTYDDGTERRYELVNGVLIEMASESTINTWIAMYLAFAFGSLGLPAYRVGVKQKIEVPSKFVTARDPDLMIHSEESAAAIADRTEACLKQNEPNPLIIIEVVSPGTESTDNYQRDYIQKPMEYADRKIAEFWQVDPDRAWVRVLTLNGEVYEVAQFMGNETIVSPTFSALNLTAKQVLAAGR